MLKTLFAATSSILISQGALAVPCVSQGQIYSYQANGQNRKVAQPPQMPVCRGAAPVGAVRTIVRDGKSSANAGKVNPPAHGPVPVGAIRTIIRDR